MIKRILFFLVLGLMVMEGFAQDNHPVSWKFDCIKLSELTYKVQIHAVIKEPFHIYPMQSSGGGLGMPTQILFEENDNIELIGDVEEKGGVPVGDEPAAHYEKAASFTQVVKLKDDKKTTLQFRIKYMACTDSYCLPPSSKKFSLEVTDEEKRDGDIDGEKQDPAPDNKQVVWNYEDFVLPDTTGSKVESKLITSKNRYTFIDFWASWCTPCRAQGRELIPIYKSYHQKGFDVIGISLDTDAKAWKRAIRVDKYPWTNLSDLKGFESEMSKRYGITEIPRNFLVDSNGKIIAKDLHGKELEDKLVALFGQGSDEFTITGRYGVSDKPAKAYLEYTMDGKSILDSVGLKNGFFKFTGKASSSPVPANLIFDAKGAGRTISMEERSFYLEPGIIRFETKGATVLGSQVTGTPYNDDNNDLDILLDSAISKMPEDDRKFMEGKLSPQSTTDYEAKLEGFRVRFSNLTIDAYTRFIKSHPTSMLSLKLFPKVAYEQQYSVVKPLFDGLSPIVRNSEEGKKLADNLEKMRVTAIGQPAPDFEMPDTEGNLVKLSSFRGKYVLLDFWASWCGPCRAENPNLVKIFNKYKDQNFTIVGISLDKAGSKAAWLAAIKKDGLPWLQLSDLKFWDSPAAKLYGVQAIPQNFLIDPNGIIVGKTLMGKALDDRLEEISRSAVR